MYNLCNCTDRTLTMRQLLTCGKLLSTISATLYFSSWFVPKLEFYFILLKATFMTSRHVGDSGGTSLVVLSQTINSQVLWNSGHWHLSAFFSQLHIYVALGILVDLLLTCTSRNERTIRPVQSNKEIWWSSPKANPVETSICLKFLQITDNKKIVS